MHESLCYDVIHITSCTTQKTCDSEEELARDHGCKYVILEFCKGHDAAGSSVGAPIRNDQSLYINVSVPEYFPTFRPESVGFSAQAQPAGEGCSSITRRS